MAFTAFPEGARGDIFFSWNGVGTSIGLHFEKPTPIPADFVTLALRLAVDFAANMRAFQTAEVVMGDVVVRDLSSVGAPKFTDSSSSGLLGLDGTDAVPNNTAPIVSHRTLATGRSGRGRTYLVGLSEVKESNGLLLSGTRDSILAAWGVFITAVEVSGWVFSVAQQFSAGVRLVTGVMRPVITEIMLQELGTQRRRQVPSAV